MAIFCKYDEKGYYIDVIDNDDDYVTLMKVGDSFIYRIRGPVAEHMHNIMVDNAELKNCYNAILEQRDFAMKERDELLYAIYHTRAVNRFLSNNKNAQKGESNGY